MPKRFQHGDVAALTWGSCAECKPRPSAARETSDTPAPKAPAVPLPSGVQGDLEILAERSGPSLPSAQTRTAQRLTLAREQTGRPRASTPRATFSQLAPEWLPELGSVEYVVARAERLS